MKLRPLFAPLVLAGCLLFFASGCESCPDHRKHSGSGTQIPGQIDDGGFILYQTINGANDGEHDGYAFRGDEGELWILNCKWEPVGSAGGKYQMIVVPDPELSMAKTKENLST